MHLSDRLSVLPASPIRKLVPLAVAAKSRGITVYHLNIGDPDIKTPQVMLDVLRNWHIETISYGQSQGNPDFLAALASYYRTIGFPFVGPGQIQATSGGSEAISLALFSVCNPGDDVIVFEPFYANYNSYAVVNGVRLVPVPTSIADGFHLPARATVEAAITPNTRAILICTPNNPTGTVYTKDEMDMLVDIAVTRNLYLLSDEVYREFTYDGKHQVSLLSYMEAHPDRLVVLDSLSKRYSLCGARLGAVISLNPDLMAGILKIAQGRLSSGTVDQTMAAKLTDVPASYMDAVHEEYEKRRDLLYRELKKIPGVTVPKPEGAFYAIVGLPVADAEDFCRFLLTDFSDHGETVMLAPAAGFYATPGRGKNEVRIAYVLNCDAIKRSAELIAKALEAYAALDAHRITA
jgi:aspartate aminotransferase